MPKKKQRPTYTAYVVGDIDLTDKFLSSPTYTGRNRDAWSHGLENAFIFDERRQATTCAFDINRRNNYGIPIAKVVPIQLFSHPSRPRKVTPNS